MKEMQSTLTLWWTVSIFEYFDGIYSISPNTNGKLFITLIILTGNWAGTSQTELIGQW